MMARRLALLLPLLAWLAACAAPPATSTMGDTHATDIAALTQAILDLGPGVDPEEAARAARVTYDYMDQLVIEYQIVDPPLIHNTKVNMGLKPRGLCWHWATDTEARLKAENFKTLVLYRAIANADNPILIDHSTAIIARKGDGLYDGIVLDGWRHGGELFWSPVLEDTRYRWVPREVVLEKRRARLAKKAARSG